MRNVNFMAKQKTKRTKQKQQHTKQERKERIPHAYCFFFYFMEFEIIKNS